MSKMHSSIVMLTVALLMVLPCAIVQAETIGFWRLNEGNPGDQTTGAADEIIDSSGNNHHGYAVGSPLPSYVAADDGYDPPSAIQLTTGTVKDCIVIPASTDFNLMLADLQDYTFEAFIKTSYTGGYQTIFWTQSDPYQQYRLGIDQTTGKLALYMDVGGGLNLTATGDTNVRNGQWRHVAVVIDADTDPDLTSATFYVDYEDDGTTYFDDVVPEGESWVNTNVVNTGDLWIGDLDYSTTYQFKGDISMVRSSTGALTPGQFYVPEPSMFALLAAGLIGLLAYAWRKRK